MVSKEVAVSTYVGNGLQWPLALSAAVLVSISPVSASVNRITQDHPSAIDTFTFSSFRKSLCSRCFLLDTLEQCSFSYADVSSLARFRIDTLEIWAGLLHHRWGTNIGNLPSKLGITWPSLEMIPCHIVTNLRFLMCRKRSFLTVLDTLNLVENAVNNSRRIPLLITLKQFAVAAAVSVTPSDAKTRTSSQNW